MNSDSIHAPTGPSAAESPILLVPYMWVGDFVRCHTVARLLRRRFPDRPIDVLTTTLTAPLVRYMPGLRKGITSELQHGRLTLAKQWRLAGILRAEHYGTAIVLPRTWKAALAPFLAGIPERTGFVGEGRYLLLNDLRSGERRLPRMIDRCVALALPGHAQVPEPWPQVAEPRPQAAEPWPAPQLVIPPAELAVWQERRELAGGGPVVAFAPGSVAAARRWPAAYYAELARRLAAEGVKVLVLGGPSETELGREIADTGHSSVRNLTGPDLLDAVFALRTAHVTVSNDSGLLHVSAALGTPTIGLFGPGAPYLSAPLNPLAAIVETVGELPCRPCGRRVCPLQHHRCMRDITVEQVLEATRRALSARAS